MTTRAKKPEPPRRGRDGKFMPGRVVNVSSCSVETCEKQSEKRGWCGTHYYRWHQHGDVRAHIPVRPIGDLEQQIMGKVRKDLETGHWFWVGHVNAKTGYGMVNLRGTPTGAHRAVYEHLVGPIPPGHEPDHVCHVRHCVNVLDPQHVEVVTRAENVRRSVEYKRERRQSA